MDWKIIESADGSPTLRSEALKETYHSRHGAVQESMHVFIQNGLALFPTDAKLSILEVGFGTGLNTFLTVENKQKRTIHYTTLEPYPVPQETLIKINYGKLPTFKDKGGVFEKLHEAAWERDVEITEGFTLHKKQLELTRYREGSSTFDLVYYDAFGFHAQPEMWGNEIWKHLHGMLKPGGIWVSYCAKGEVRRGLAENGFIVERLPGPPGKREMLRCIAV